MKLNLPFLVATGMLVGAAPVAGQQATGGRVASSAAGQAGQRQTREQPIAGIEPLARIDNRIQNRVQSRQRTRIDRFYDPQANARSPFETAAERARAAGRTRR